MIEASGATNSWGNGEITLAVEVKNVSFAYGAGPRVFSDLSLSVKTGECHAILGASGCGKSTLLKMVAGLLPITSASGSDGVVRLANIDVSQEKPAFEDLKRRGTIGYFSQNPLLFNNMTVEQNVAFPTEVLGTYQSSKIAELIELVGLCGHELKHPSELSGGMRTRTALARLFSTSPKILLLDEPFSSLDLARRLSLYELFKELNAEFSTTTILVTHDVFEAMVFAPRISLMSLAGAITPYEVDEWNDDLNYISVVEKYFADFSRITKIISSDD